MISLNTLIGKHAATFTPDERLALLKALHELAHVDGNYALIEQIGLESIAALLFPQTGEDIQAMERLSGVDPLTLFEGQEKRSIVLDTMCFTALSDSVIHSGEVAMIVHYAREWGFPPAALRKLSCFDPMMLLEQGLSKTGEELMNALEALFSDQSPR